MKTNIVTINSIMKNSLKYICAALILLGMSTSAWGTTTSFSYSDLHGQGASGSGAPFTGASKGSITMSGVGNGNSSYVQIYNDGTLTFTPLSGATITKITITATTSSYARTWSASTGSVSVSNETITWTGSSTSTITLTNTNSSQARLTDMEVTYTIGTTYDVKWYVGGVIVEHETAAEPVVIVPNDVDDGDLGGSCSSYAFMGWSETNIGSTPTNTRPADLFFDAPIINENKEYYAVFADCSDENAWEITSIDPLTSGTGYAPYNGTHTASGISYTSYQVMEQSSLIQFQSNAGYMYNTTAFSQSITRIAITSESSYWSVYASSSEINSAPSSGALTPSTVGTTLTFWAASTGQTYFRIKGGDDTPKASSIKVYYGTVSNYITSCTPCSENPSVSDASLNGYFNVGGVTSLTNLTDVFSVTGSTVGEDCSYAENGFVWSSTADDATELQKGETGVTYISGTTPDGSGGFTGSLSGTWSVGTTYYYRSYVKNNGDNIAYYPASGVLSFIPRSVTFNSNEGSDVATLYVRSGGTVSAPSNPTKTGFVFGGWYQESGLVNEVDWSATITADKIYYAKWLTYTDYKFSCAELTLEAHPETASGPIFITSAADKKVRSQGYIQITGSGLTPSTTLTFPSLPAKFEIKTATYGDLATDATGAIDAAAYIFYTPAADATSDGLDKITGITVTVGGAKTKTATLTQDIIGRHLPADFVIAGKKDGKWYALPANMTSTDHPTPAEIAVDNTTTPTIAYTNANNKYGLEGPTTGASSNISNGDGQYVKLTMHPLSDAPLFGQAPSNTGIGKSGTAIATNNLSEGWWWQLKQTNTSITNPKDAKYTIYCANNTSSLSIKDNAGNPEWGLYASGIDELRLIPASSIVFAEAEIVEWGQHGAIIEVDATAINATKVKANLNGAESAIVTASTTGTSVKGTATKYNYTAAFGNVIDFAAAESNGAMLTLEWYNSSDVLVGVSNIIVPKIIAEDGVMKSIMSGDAQWETEVHVLPGVTLEANAGDFGNNDVMIKHLEIYPGATVVVTEGSQASGTLKVKTLVLRNGWKRIGGKAYDVARLYVTPSTASLAKNASDDVWYSDWYIDFDQYYPIAVPWEVTVANMSYKNTKSAVSVGTEDSNSVRLRYYDGNSRATNVQTGVGDGANWKAYGAAGAESVPEKLLPSKGYAMTAKRPTGKAFSIIRMPLTFTNAWGALGEQGSITVESVTIHKDQVEVTAYGVKPESKTPYAEGWNFIANPYMALYQGAITLTPAEGDATTINVVNIPDVDFKEYGQYATAATKLKPSSGFLIQTPQTGTVTFGTGNRKPSAPSYRTEAQTETRPEQQVYIVLNNENAEDMMGLFVSDKYTADYDINGDVEKLLSDGTSLRTYMHYGDMNLAYVALTETLAKEWIPVSVRIPSVGEYTFSLHEASIAGELESVYLIDYENGNQVTNLLTDSYTFYSEAGTFTDRFSINAIVGERETPTGVDAVNSGVIESDKPIKFLFHEKVYILYHGIIYDATGKKVREINK